MGCNRSLVAVVLLCLPLWSQQTVALEKRVATAQAALQASKLQLSVVYERLETALSRGREQFCAGLQVDLDTALSAARNLGNAPRAKLLAEVKKSLQGMERNATGAGADLSMWLQQRLPAVLQNEVAAGLQMKAQEFAALVLEPLVREGRPFHQIWNEELAASLPAAESWRKANTELSAAEETLLAAKDPSAAFRRGAPAGFARIPAGNYMTIFTAGFSGQGVRKKDRPFVLDHDVFLGIHEVTNAQYLAWLLKLTEEERRIHQPRDAANKPLWEPEPGSGIVAVPVGSEALPITCVTFASALAFAHAHDARLPTEEEWCAAAAGREKLTFPWGSKYEPGRSNDRDSGNTAPMPVGSYPTGANAFGHMDLAGNVAEWTMTYESGKVADAAALAQESVAVRGGSFRCGDRDVSTGWVWLKRAIGDRDAETGFRLLIDPGAKPR